MKRKRGRPKSVSDGSNSSLKAPRLKDIYQDEFGQVLEKIDQPSASKEVFKISLDSGRVEFTLPLRTVSEANCFEPWQKRHKRHKAQKKAVFFAMLPIKQYIRMPCKVTFIRYAPKELDVDDNLNMSVKYIRDGVAEQITQDFVPGRADNHKGFSWGYGQVKCKEYSVKVIIQF